jgi:hypothetical protein
MLGTLNCQVEDVGILRIVGYLPRALVVEFLSRKKTISFISIFEKGVYTLINILLMEVNQRLSNWRGDNSDAISPFRRYKAMRNKSMPDLTELRSSSPTRAEGRFQYNKWYIKPEQRLKKKLVTQRSSFELESSMITI